jgi:hypothetical protein
MSCTTSGSLDLRISVPSRRPDQDRPECARDTWPQDGTLRPAEMATETPPSLRHGPPLAHPEGSRLAQSGDTPDE